MTHIFTHMDLDGFVAAMLACNISGANYEDVHWTSYDANRDSKWKSEIMKSATDFLNSVWFVDLSLQEPELDWARSLEPKDWLWCDHHETSQKFPRSHEIFHTSALDCSGNRCAADILYEGFVLPGEKTEVLQQWVERAHDRDLWINKEKENNLKLDLVIKSHLKGDRMPRLFRAAETLLPREIIDTYKSNWTYGMRKFEESCMLANHTIKHFGDNELPVSICTIKGYGSDVADEVYKTGEEVLVLTQKFYDGSYGFSLRTRRVDIDLSEVARHFGGGGHRQAAGGKLTPVDINAGQEFIAMKILAACLECQITLQL